MSQRLQRMLNAIRGRKGYQGGITTADSFIKVVKSCIDDRRFWKFLNLGSSDEWRKALSLARRKLVYFDPAQKGLMGGCRKSVQGESGPVLEFGQSKRKDANKLTPGAVMDFECILTSMRKDRDRDVLHPDGAEVDKRMPLLWQHIPMEPCGKLLSVLSQDKESVVTAFSIIDSPLGRDAAQLAEFGALRISHGFQPTKFHALEDDSDSGEGTTDMFSGWEIEKYKVMEGSLVSIPSNEDAVITAYSREKLHHPLIKEWGKSLFDGRPAQVTNPGFQASAGLAGIPGMTLNLNMNGAAPFLGLAGGGGSQGTGQGGGSHLPGTGSLAASVNAMLDRRQGLTAARKATLAASITKQADSLLANGLEREQALAEAYSLLAMQKADEGSDGGSGDAGGESGDTDADAGEEARVTMSSITDAIDAAAGAADLPQEAGDRLQVIQGMLGTLKDNLDEHTQAVSEAANNQDLAGLFAGMQQMVEGIMSQLAKLCDELETIMTLEGMPEAAITSLQDAYDGIETIRDEMSEMASSAQDVEDEAGEETSEEGSEDEPLPEEEGELITENMEEEDEEEKAEGSEDEEEDTEEKAEGDSEEDDDEEVKAEGDDSDDDEEDTEEKEALASDDENDESMEDPTPDDDVQEGKGGRRGNRISGKQNKACDDVGYKLLGSLAAGKTIDPELIADLINALEERQAANIERILATV